MPTHSVVLITGASTGIGRLAAETAARAGHTVYAGMREMATRNAPAAEAIKSIAAKEKLLLHTVELDVSNADSIQRAVDRVLAEAGRLDVAVNNAGLMSIGITEGFTEEQALHQMDVNFMGSFRVSRAVLPHLRKQKSGLLINVTSIVGRLLFPGCALYCASKFAQEALAEVLHYELTGTGVESVIVEPGPYPTQLLANSPAPADQNRVASYGPLSSLREAFVGQFEQLFSSAESPDPQDVADAIRKLIEQPAGQRPLRTVCGLDYGAQAVSEQVAPIQAEVLKALGMEHMVAPLAVVKYSKLLPEFTQR
jgi:NAD(P)-dependent dehydrogenase (short-subunit alcohol dehydrogenase family)